MGLQNDRAAFMALLVLLNRSQPADSKRCVCLFFPHSENLDAMIALQTKNKLGKALGNPDFAALAGK